MFEAWSYPCPQEGFTLRGWHTVPSGKPVIHFLHGNGFCGRTYEPMLQALATDFDLWLCDIQGHGDSDHGGDFVGWNRNAALALQAFEHHRALFGDVPCHAVGHSFGGVLTGLILGSSKHPFERAVLLDPVIFSQAMLMGMSVISMVGVGRLTPLAKAAMRRRWHWPNRAAAYESLHGRGTYKGWTEEALHAFVNHAIGDQDDGSVALKCQPRREADIFSSAPERLWSSIGRIRIPTTIFHGQDTMPFVGPSARLAASSNDWIQEEQVPGGHCFMQEKPLDAAQRVRIALTGV